MAGNRQVRFMAQAASAAALVAATPALAADEDVHAWIAVNAVHDIGARGVLTLEGQLRLTDNAARAGQILLRPSIGIKLDKTTTAALGYAYVRTDPLGPALTNEHRLWQQLAFRLAGDGKGVTLTGRSRMEQRWVEGSGDTGWRFRQQLRLTAPLAGKVRAVAWSEAFVALDTTAWGQNSGIDRWRNAVALSLPVSGTVTVEPGYINQWVSHRAQDRVHHIASLTLSGRF